ncbi:MAG: cystathionine beta-lyase [Glaciecola sp.]|jgi:cystathionine beta-lyase
MADPINPKPSRISDGGSPTLGIPFATDPATLERVFGTSAPLLPLWVAEPDLPLSPAIIAAVQERANSGWYGYEARPAALQDAFQTWTQTRHGWATKDLHVSLSPSVGTSIGVLLDLVTATGDAVILQPPVFTDFKPLVTSRSREVLRNALLETGGAYRMDLDDLARLVAGPSARALVLCNPHNPVGRAWSEQELRDLAQLCAAHDVTVIADEIHADLALPGHTWTPFAKAAEGTGVRWAALHGPIKTFGLAGLCDTLVLTDDADLHDRFEAVSGRLHLTRNNVLGLAAMQAAYEQSGPWLDQFLWQVADNLAVLRERLPSPLRLVEPEATYLAWIDFRELALDVPALARWLVSAGLALSPGHWFGREGAGFARMTVAVPTERIHEAMDRLSGAMSD